MTNIKSLLSLKSSAAMFAAIALTAAGVVVVSQPAFAQEQPLEVIGERQDNPTRRVTYADLDLASLAGQKSLKGRVSRAVTSVCDEAVGPNADFHAEHACRSGAWSGAAPQMTLAFQRAREIAATGSSSIAAVTIRVVLPK